MSGQIQEINPWVLVLLLSPNFIQHSLTYSSMSSFPVSMSEVTMTPALSTEITPSIVSLSFHQAVFSRKKRQYEKKAGSNALLELEVLGDRHTFHDVAEKLFQYYLAEVRGEQLYEHVWRFEPVGDERADGETVALDHKVPLLSSYMMAREPYQLMFVEPFRYQVKVGMPLIFFYDEGSPSVISVTINSIEPLSSSLSADLFPRVKGDNRAFSDIFVQSEGGTGSAESSEPSVPVDTVLASLARAMTSCKYGPLRFGRCNKDVACTIEGGVAMYGDQVFCPLPFSSFEECLIAMNKAMKMHEDISEEEFPKIQPGFTNIFIFPPEAQSSEEERMIESTRQLHARVDHFDEIGFTREGLRKFPDDDKPTKLELDLLWGGPKVIIARMTPEEMAAERARLVEQGVDFSARFPHLTAKLNGPNEKFLYFAVENRCLTVARKMKKKDRTPFKTFLNPTSRRFNRLEDIFQAVEQFFQQNKI